jgi:ferredoxin like protein
MTQQARQAESLDGRLGLVKYETDPDTSHIHLDADRCSACKTRPCTTVCPAFVYRWVDDHVAVRYENCLECGACQIACDSAGNRGLDWRNPAGGFGVIFRFG